MTSEKTANNKAPCNGCGGSGQISFFRGVSRFVMDWEDCPDCLGTGLAPSSKDDSPEQAESNAKHSPDE